MATNKVYYTPGTATTFMESDATYTFTLDDGVAAADGQVSDQWDRGTGSLPARYKWDAIIKWVATPTLGDICRLYLYASQATAADLTGDGAATPETKLGNFALIGQVICSVAADQAFYGSGVVEIYGRYVTLGAWNASATKALNATADACKVTLTAIPDDIQAAA